MILPESLNGLASWFAEAVRGEVQSLEKNGGAQTHEIHSGKLLEQTGSNEGLFSFILADGTRIPEDSTGRLIADGLEYSATVTSQFGNIIQLYVEGSSLPKSIYIANFIIDDTGLLRKLAEVLEGCANDTSRLSTLASLVFHPQKAAINRVSLPQNPVLDQIKQELRLVIEKVCGSPVSYIWGPPGTGKTYAIAHLITTLVEIGERVLVTSHTHAAVDQALYEAIKNEQSTKGPLAEHPLLNEGRILRIGITIDQKIPDDVRLDKLIETKSQKIQQEILLAQAQLSNLNEIIEDSREIVRKWDQLSESQMNLININKEIEKKLSMQMQAKTELEKARELVVQRNAELQKAQKAWLLRDSKIAHAQNG